MKAAPMNRSDFAMFAEFTDEAGMQITSALI